MAHKSYTSRPDRGAAQVAWDYFASRYAKGRRGIACLFYSPNCHGARAWVCELESLPEDTMHWGVGGNDFIKDASCRRIKAWADNRS